MTPRAPSTVEVLMAQKPALRLMRAMGWEYLTPAEAMAKRLGLSDVVLFDELSAWLTDYRFTFRGRQHPLSGQSVAQIVREVSSPTLRDGLMAASEAAYNRLLLGVTVTEFVDGKAHSVTVPLIDWETPEANRFRVTEEFEVQKAGGNGHRRPDIVGFVNGLPLVVIEAKRPDNGGKGMEAMLREGISQHIRNQRSDEIPHLFAHAQLLMSIDGSNGRYGTVGTAAKFYARWREEELGEEAMEAIKRKPPPSGRDPLYGDLGFEAREQMEGFTHGPVLVNDMDRMLIGLLRPDRFIDFVRYSTFYNRKYGKIAARYQQVFGIRALLDQLQTFDADGARQGGVIWHTTGSGKSFTMVMLCKAMLLHPSLRSCRILVVTDRKDLEKQLGETFIASGALGSSDKVEESKASSGRDLAARIGMGEDRILFSTMQRFASAMKRFEASNESSDLIVLIDEGHRSHSGETHERLRMALPKAAFVAFTGTPLLKDDKTKNTFGAILHSYTMQRAVEDGTVAPLLYEARKPELSVNEAAIDAWFDRVTEPLTDAQRGDLKKKYARRSAVSEAEGRIFLIAYDISQHFLDNIKVQGLKGQLATSSRRAAILYKKALDEIGEVTSEIIMSPPDTREGHEEVDGELPLIQEWWSENVTGDPEQREKNIIRDFGEEGKPDILIVIDKLLTGFDEPMNAALYIDKDLKEHTLIQAIARVNRLHEEKKFGLLVDYRGILADLDSALQSYAELAQNSAFDPDDLDGLFKDVSTEYKKLPKLHKAVWAQFDSIKNTDDREQYRQHLMPRLEVRNGINVDINQKRREDFYEALTAFALALKTALGSRSFFEDASITEETRDRYKRDLKFFSEIRRAARADANETIDYSDYEKQIERLLDRHIHGVNVDGMDGLLDLSNRTQSDDPDDWNTERTRSEAELIRTRITRTIEQELDIDPYAQQHFSALLQTVLKEAEALFKHPRDLFEKLRELEDDINKRDSLILPDVIRDNPQQSAYYGVLKTALSDEDETKMVEAAQDIDAIVLKAVSEHSVNPAGIENGIRQGVLPLLFKLCGLEKAKPLTDEIVRIVQLGLSR